MSSFGETWALVLELWPNWKPTKGQVQEWRDRLGIRDQAVVQHAVRDHFSLDGSKDSFSPRLARVLERVRAVMESGESLGSEARGRWRAVWRERRNGMDVWMAGSESFASRTAVLDRYGDGVTPTLLGGAAAAIDQAEAFRDDAVMRSNLIGWGDARLDAACERALRMNLGLRRESLSRPVMEWSRWEVGCVRAVGER